MNKYRLGLDFGGVISEKNTSSNLMVDFLGLFSLPKIFEDIYIISRIDDLSSIDRVLNYIKGHKIPIHEDNIFFCLRRKDKAIIAKGLGLTHFVDNRPEVLFYMKDVQYKYALNPLINDMAMFPAVETQYMVMQDWDQLLYRLTNFEKDNK